VYKREDTPSSMTEMVFVEVAFLELNEVFFEMV
jgi:hypothetical protein